MAENIKDYGGIEDDDSASACDANVQAIEEASTAASDNTVYLPAGTWYIGSTDIASGQAIQAGCDAPDDRGAAGLSFTGDGPTKSFLSWGQLTEGSRNEIRYCDADHGDITWDNITYEGRWRHFRDQGYDFNDGGLWGVYVDGGASGTFEMTNVRLRGMAGNGFYSSGTSVDYYFDRCTFYDNGMGVDDATNGDKVQHHTRFYAKSGSSATVKNSEFRLCSGSVCDANGDSSGDGTVKFENVYAEGAGVSFYKINDVGNLVDRNVHFVGETSELVDDMDGESRASYFYRLSGDSGYEPTIEQHNVLMETLPGFAYRVTSDRSLRVQGGTDGPVAVTDAAQISSLYTEALSGDDGTLVFDDFGDISVHNVNGDVCALGASDGSIDTLHWDNADSLGNGGSVSIGTETKGGSQFDPSVPSKSDVGINSNGSSSGGSAPSVSWTAPTDGDTVSGSATLQVDASDAEDSDDSLTVEYRVDGASWTATSYDSSTGYYVANWDSTTVGDGSHTLEARATDSAGDSSTASVGVTVDNKASLFDDWTVQWESTTSDWTVVSGSEYEGSKALAYDASSSDRHAISWDAVGSQSDVEVLDRVRITESGLLGRLQVRASGSAGNESGYWLEFESRNDSFRLGKYTNGGYSTLKRFGSVEQDTFYYRRFRAEGDTLKVKIWPASESEPSDWSVEVTDTTHDSGWVGLGGYSAGAAHTDTVSVATGGDTAPFVGEENSDNAPTVSWAAPSGGSTLSGDVALEIDASDAEDSDDSLTVEYRVDGASWTATSYDSSTGYYVANWDSTTVGDGAHTLEARATDSAGNSATTAVDVTVDNVVDVATVEARDVTDSSATLAGEVTSLGGASSVDVAFEWRAVGADSWSTAGSQTVSSTGEFTASVSGLDGGTDYEFRAVATAPDTVTANPVTFTTGTVSNAAPTIERFEVTDLSDTGWSQYEVDWAVADADGNLDKVVTTLQRNGMVVAAESTGVSGADANYSHVLRVRGAIDEVTLSVNDTKNRIASDSKQV